VKAFRAVRLEQRVAKVEAAVTQGESPLGFSGQNIGTTEIPVRFPVIIATLSMVRRGAAQMGRLALAVVAAMANASILGILPVLEMISAVVCTLISCSYLASSVDNCEFTLYSTSKWIYLLPRQCQKPPMQPLLHLHYPKPYDDSYRDFHESSIN
jgi:hypothetical protein